MGVHRGRGDDEAAVSDGAYLPVSFLSDIMPQPRSAAPRMVAKGVRPNTTIAKGMASWVALWEPKANKMMPAIKRTTAQPQPPAPHPRAILAFLTADSEPGVPPGGTCPGGGA